MPLFPSRVDASLSRWRPSALARTAIVFVFAASTLMQVVGVPFTSSFGTRTRIDLDVYRLGSQLWQQGISLYDVGSMPFTDDGIWLPFTYPPFAALSFVPLGAMPLTVAGWFVALTSIALVVVIIKIVLRVLDVGTPANRWWLATAIAAAAIWLNPTWMTLGFGQVNIYLLALIVIDVFVLSRRGRARGILIGVASAIKLTPLVFVAVFIAARQWRAAATVAVTFACAAALAAVWMPSDSWRYWTHTLFHTTRIGDPAGPINQNLNALWIRLVDSESAQQMLWFVSSVIATGLMVLAVRAARPVAAFASDAPQRRVDAMSVTIAIATWGLLISPTTWGHHWVWVIPAIIMCAVIAARSDERRTRWVHAALAVSGAAIFAVGPYQLLPQQVGDWNLIDQIVGNSYTLWGLCLLIALWLAPARLPASTHSDGELAPESRSASAATPTS
ncbi:glycosyltransferase 87 family protein [Gordonia sp. CPCC 205333]|uniref:glycosyltransferase 87 family protein n=1 Tax=Gordonia sp. CPCC 205333 TaxID=3140790 RepID=UPI003AF38B99